MEGLVVSGDQFIAEQSVREHLIRDFHGDCAEMEGAAIAQAAYLNKLPFVIIRAISDKADHSAQMDYPTFEKQCTVSSSPVSFPNILLLSGVYPNT